MTRTVYQLRIKGHLPAIWAEEFGDMALQCEPDGSTALTGELPDQAALHGLLLRIRDLGLTLISINPVFVKESEDHEPAA